MQRCPPAPFSTTGLVTASPQGRVTAYAPPWEEVADKTRDGDLTDHPASESNTSTAAHGASSFGAAGQGFLLTGAAAAMGEHLMDHVRTP